MFQTTEILLIALRVQTIWRESFELLGQMDDRDGREPKFIRQIALPDQKNVLKELGQSYKMEILIQNHLQDLCLFYPFGGIKGVVWGDMRISYEMYKVGLKVIKSARMVFLDRKNKNFLDPKKSVWRFWQRLVEIARGQFSSTRQLGLCTLCFCEAFEFQECFFYRDHVNLAFVIQPRRIPIVDASNRLVGFKFQQHIQLYPYFLKRRDGLRTTIKNELLQLKGDYDRFDCFMPNYVLSHLPLEKRFQAAFGKLDCFVDLRVNQIMQQYIFHPKKFTPMYLQEEFAKNYKKLADGRFSYPLEFEHIQDKFKKANDSIMEAVSDERGAEQLLRLIKSIPQLRFKLTIEQEKMISTPNNLLCLGRSGTGKTTSSALRLFSTDVYFKYMEELRKFKLANPDKLNQHFQVDPYFLNNSSQLRLVFVTFSPVLTNEVRKFYHEIKQHFIQELIKRRERALKKQKQLQQEEVKGQDQIEDGYEIDDEYFEENKDSETSTQIDKKDYEDYLRLEKELLQDDEEIEKQMKLPHTIDNLNSDHFPLFVTIKRLIYMLDASLQYSFFSRNNEGQIVGMESNVEWHNETRGVFMINQYYKQQRNYDEQIKNLGNKILKIEEDLETEDNQEIFKNLNVDGNKSNEERKAQVQFNVSETLGSMIQHVETQSYNIQGRQLSFEVDFEIFRVRFWPKVSNWSKLQPLVVWTEIYSVIKGGSDTYNYHDCILPLEVYVGDVKRSTKKLDSAKFLTLHEKLMIYQIFLHYEKWKDRLGGYDFNDVVSHIIKQFRSDLKPSQTIHFLMVDEVQDLTPNVLHLLTTITQKNIFFCGDTAQTIAKGVGFRFYDLQQVFKHNPNIEVPSVLQLTKNFRSHSKILDLANSVVSLVELLFPKTIDKLLKETSELDGPKPIFIDSCSDDQLRNLLFGRAFNNVTQSNVSSAQVEGAALQKPQFGCNQVLIVRDQESKLQVPEFLQNMLCLTVYEAKGLEFDDVILFNFFQDSKCGHQWMLMKDIDFVMTKIKKYKDFDFLDFETLDIKEKEESKEKPVAQKTQNIIVGEDEELSIELSLKRERGEVFRQFAQLCTELKFLYVAITRPKKVLIIYDTDHNLRRPLQDFWQKIGLISVISKDMILNTELLPLEVSNVLYKDIQTSQATKEQWKFQGILLFKKKFYNSAIQCFRNAEEKELELRCLAYQHADKASVLLGEAESRMLSSKNKLYKKFERNQFLREAKDMKGEANKELEIAGGYFEKIGMLRHAAQCYCSASRLQKAGQMFESLVDYGQSAECYLKTGDIRKAAEFYAKAGLFANSFECYERLQDWEGLLLCLSKYKDSFKKEERESLIEKYFPIALNQLYHLYMSLDPMAPQMDEENKGKFQEMKIKLKFQKSISIIKEDDDEYDDSISEDEEAETVQEVEKSQAQNQETSMISIEESKSFELIDTNTNQEQNPPSSKKSKFDYFDNDEELKSSVQQDDDVIEENDLQKDQEQMKQIISTGADKVDEFEVLSSLDPEDEFLQSHRSVSLIESILSKNTDSFSIISSKSSEFSIIQNSKMHSIILSVYSLGDQQQKSEANQSIDLMSQISEISNQNDSALSLMNSSRFSTIEQARDTYAEDIVMQKIIFYVSLFSQEVKDRLKEMRSKGALGHLDLKLDSQSQDPHDIGFDNQFMLIDLDDISEELLYLILDTLEHYELFRLCLIICNRYNLKEKISRYLVSIGNKYSNLKIFKNNFFKKINKVSELQAQENYEKIAMEAMHNVMAIIEKSYFHIDEQGKDTINLRESCFDYLLLQGFWKKLVFLMDVDSALQLTKSMGDHESFKLLYLVYKCSVKDPQQIKNLLTSTDAKGFQDLIHQDVNQMSKILGQEVLIAEEIQRFKNAVVEQRLSLTNQARQSKENKQLLNNARFFVTKKAQEFFNENKKPEFGSLKKISAYLFSLISIQYVNPKDFNSFIYDFNLKEKQNLQQFIIMLLNLIKSNDLKNNSNKLSKLEKIRDEIRRIIYLPFNVFCLDGLPLFEKFSQQYMIVAQDSIFLKQIIDKQEKQQRFFQNVKVSELYTKNKSQYQYNNILTNFLTQQKEKLATSLDSNIEFNQLLLAQPCDLGLKYMLVPKLWLDEILIAKAINFCSLLNGHIESYLRSLTERVSQLGHLKFFTLSQRRLRSNIVARKNLNESWENLLKAIVPNHLHHLLENTDLDSMPGMITRVLDKTQHSLGQLKLLALKENRNIWAQDQSIIFMPDSPHKPKLNINTYQKAIMLDLGITQIKEAFVEIGNKEKFYPKILRAFRLFVLADEYTMMMEVIKGQKKSIIRKEKLVAQTQLLKQISSAYLLLDAHVYLKCNLWSSCVDAIYAFINDSFNFLPFKEILFLVESAFYRALPSYFLPRMSPNQGILLPDYAVKNIDPSNKMRCRAFDNGKRMELLKINYPQVSIEKAKDIKMISEGLYWAAILIKTLNKDEDAAISEKIYCRVFNMLIAFVINTTDKELQANQIILERIKNVAQAFIDSPFEQNFQRISKFIKTDDTLEQPGLLRKKEDEFLFQWLQSPKGRQYSDDEHKSKKKQKTKKRQYGFVRISMAQQHDKEIGKKLQKIMDAAYYKELSIIARRMAASNFICRVLRNQMKIFKHKRALKLQKQSQKQLELPLEMKLTLLKAQDLNKSFIRQVKDFLAIKFVSDELKECFNNVCLMLNNYDTLLRQILSLSQSKMVVNSLDLHYLRQNFQVLNEKRSSAISHIQSLATKHKNSVLDSFYEEITTFIKQEEVFITKEQEKLAKWLETKAEPNLIEIEKKQFNIRNKWETLVQFQKRRKIMLKHLGKNKK